MIPTSAAPLGTARPKMAGANMRAARRSLADMLNNVGEFGLYKRVAGKLWL
jgi:hypothetical protein